MKKNNSDEFLVEKKNPLVLPPEFDELPEPKLSGGINTMEEETNVKKILSTNKSKTKKTLSSGNSGNSTEETILEKIKSN
jgi:hypothetical protein